MQVCFECDRWYSEDKDHPAICPECSKEIKDEKQLAFENWLFDRPECKNESV